MREGGRQEKDIWKDLGVRLQKNKTKKLQLDLGSKRNPRHIPPTAATETLWMFGGRGVRNQCPKPFSISAKPFQAPHPHQNLAFQDNPTASQLLPAVLPYHHLEFGSRGGKQTQNRPRANLSSQELSHDRGLGEQLPAPEGQVQVGNFPWDPAGEDPLTPWKLPAHPLQE